MKFYFFFFVESLMEYEKKKKKEMNLKFSSNELEKYEEVLELHENESLLVVEHMFMTFLRFHSSSSMLLVDFLSLIFY